MDVNDGHIYGSPDGDVVELDKLVLPGHQATLIFTMQRDDLLQMNRLRGNDVHFIVPDGNGTNGTTVVKATDKLIIDICDGEDIFAFRIPGRCSSDRWR